MSFALALSLALAAGQDRGAFNHERWYGQCNRNGFLGGEDHEVCSFHTKDGDRDSGSFAVERTADKVTVMVFVPNSCVVTPKESSALENEEEPYLPGSALTGVDRVAKLKAFIRSQADATDKICGRSYNYPVLLDQDLAKLLRVTDGLKPGNFRLHNPADRAPLAAKCGRELRDAWRAGMLAHAMPAGARVQLLMYTMSKEGPELAEKRFDAVPEMMGDFFAMGMGPGGSTMQGTAPASAWRDPPDDWFPILCDIAIESWSGFVELGLYGSDEPSSQLFTVRIGTGVARMEGYAITQMKMSL